MTNLTQRAAPAGAVEPSSSNAKGGPRNIGVAARVLIVTLSFVLLVQFAFLAVRMSSLRDNWLQGRVTAASAAASLLAAAPDGVISAAATANALKIVGAKSITVTQRGDTRLFGEIVDPATIDSSFDLESASTLNELESTFRVLILNPGALMTAISISPDGSERLEAVLDQSSLIERVRRFAVTYAIFALVTTVGATCALWATMWRVVLKPMRGLTRSILAFGESPHDAALAIIPSGRGDEIGRAEAALAKMQAALALELGHRKRLAELGMAVARINHDLRNMLSSAQLISDRMSEIPDPLAKRLAPRLVATLDRAIAFCQATLTYSGAKGQSPSPRAFDLEALVRQFLETAEAERRGAIRYAVDIPPKFEIYADPDQVLRIIENLGRNAAQALLHPETKLDRPASIRFAAIRTDREALIEIGDTGPGLPAELGRENFEPFGKSTQPGGAGLGLAIAADLVARNGGKMKLASAGADDFYRGARFLITLPTRSPK